MFPDRGIFSRTFLLRMLVLKPTPPVRSIVRSQGWCFWLQVMLLGAEQFEPSPLFLGADGGGRLVCENRPVAGIEQSNAFLWMLTLDDVTGRLTAVLLTAK